MDGLVIATVIAGIILILMGVFRLGGLIKYMHSMEELHKRCEEKGVKLVFSHVNEQPYKTMEKSGFIEKVGKDNFRPHIDDALEWASKLSESVKSEV
ncbi:MAG: STAS domain-containing protein [Lachnospiraceae bacterium]|nr:STAS domain-containing protein [Lachnospiraceae bacterium]